MKKQASWNTILRHERKVRGLSQNDVATVLDCDPKTVGRWERGEASPSPHHVRQLMRLFQKDAHQLGLLVSGDEISSRSDTRHKASQGTKREATLYTHIDWGDAPYVEHFYGRASELALAQHWVLEEHCRVVAFLGMGGSGKTTFARELAERLKGSFSYVYWYSLQNTPPLEDFLNGCLRAAGIERAMESQPLEASLTSLLELCTRQHCLLILDNAESLLQSERQVGHYLEGYEAYGRLLECLGEHPHQSCLLLTSREKPREIAHMEGVSAPVRTLALPAMGLVEGQQLLQEKELWGESKDWEALLRLYSGNPLALKLASAPIHELFDGQIAEFLMEGEAVFGDIYTLLDRQFCRLSALEQDIMQWLAIEREPVSMNALRENLVYPVTKGMILDAVDSLRRRSMLETSADHRFTLQPVIMEYMLERFVEFMFTRLRDGLLNGCGNYALLKAQASDYIRESQARLILQPLSEKLLSTFGHIGCRTHLKGLLDRLREDDVHATGYTAGNILNLLVAQRADVRGLDCSSLTIRQAYLQGSDFLQVNLAHATLLNCSLNDSFAWILCLAVSPDGQFLAAGTTVGSIRIWKASDATPIQTCNGHSEEIRSVAFSLDGRYLASGSEDHTVRIWEVESGACLHILHGHSDQVRTVAFSADNALVASAGEDLHIRLWESETGREVRVLRGHSKRIRSLAFHPQKPLLASGGDESTVRLWNYESGEQLVTLGEQSRHVRVVAFSPNGRLLASGSEDHSIMLWRTEDYQRVAILRGHSSRVRTMQFSADSMLLASGSDDQTIGVWDMASYERLHSVRAHENRIWSVVFVPGSTHLISTSEDDTVRWWDRRTMLCLRTLRGYTNLLKSVAFSPDGRYLVSGSEDRTVRLWNTDDGRALRTMRGHQNRVRSVAYSSDGLTLASGSEDECVRLWDARTGHCLRVLRGHTHLVRAIAFNAEGTLLASGSHDLTIRLWEVSSGQEAKRITGIQSYIWAIAFHPEGKQIACGTDDPIIRLWDIQTGTIAREFTGHSHRVWSLDFSRDGRYLASCSDDQAIRLWDVATGDCLRVMEGHVGWVRALAFSPDGTLLVSGSHDQTLRLWRVETGERLAVWHGHEGWIWSVAFAPDGETLASCSDDGTIKLWKVKNQECLHVLRSVRAYEGTDITGVVGLSDAQREALLFLGAVERS